MEEIPPPAAIITPNRVFNAPSCRLAVHVLLKAGFSNAR